jgi:xanthine dehydrogenase YagR molybdenum-binding subunit
MTTVITHSLADAALAPAVDSSGAATKTVSMPIGIPGYTLHDEQRTVPASEPPVLPVNKDLDFIGKSPERWDGLAKVTGRARYTADVQLPGMLYACFVNAPLPHARVLSIDTSAAESHPGVKGVHVIESLLGAAVLRDPTLERTKYPIVRFAGQPVAAVAATTPQAAVEAAAKVKVKYEALPFVVDADLAREPKAPLVFPGPADEAGTAGGGGSEGGVPQTGKFMALRYARRGMRNRDSKTPT